MDKLKGKPQIKVTNSPPKEVSSPTKITNSIKNPITSPTKIVSKAIPNSPTKQTSPLQNKSPLKKDLNPSQKPKEILTPDDSEDEDDTIEELSVESKIKKLGPQTYFAKRTSFDYQKLKTIEKPMRRASAIEGMSLIKKNEMLSESGNKDMFVKFSTISEEIKTEETSEQKKIIRNDKPKRSILKNTFIDEELVLTKIFEKNTLKEVIEKIEKESNGNTKLYNDIIPKIFLETWNKNEKDPKKCLLLLKVLLTSIKKEIL